MPFAARALEKAGHGVSVKNAGPPRFRHAATKKNLPLPPAPRAQAHWHPPFAGTAITVSVFSPGQRLRAQRGRKNQVCETGCISVQCLL